MIRFIILAIIVFCLPSGMVAARMLWKYLSFRLRCLEDSRQRRIQEDINKMLH